MEWADILNSERMLQGAAALATLAAPGFMLGIAAHFVRRRRERRFCPGPRPGLLSRVHPLHWLRAGGCGYDLTAHLQIAANVALAWRTGETGAITCPECGRTFGIVRRLLTRPVHVRFFAPSIGALIVAAALLAMHPPNIARAVRAVPTPVLMAGDRWLGVQWPVRLQRELRRRHREGDLSPSQDRAMIPLLVRDLRDDKIRFNAIDARWLLTALGDDAVPHMLAALESDDSQQRREAAGILRGLGHPPSAALLHVSFDDLRHDSVPRSATSAASYLLKHLDLAETHVRRGLASDDHQQRLICAGLLAMGGRTRYTDKVMPILIAHMADNRSSGDATFAVQAIGGLGEAALPHLLPYLDAPDDQQREIARFLAVKFDPGAKCTAHIFHPPPDLLFMCRSIDPTRWGRSVMQLPYLATLPDQSAP